MQEANRLEPTAGPTCGPCCWLQLFATVWNTLSVSWLKWVEEYTYFCNNSISQFITQKQCIISISNSLKCMKNLNVGQGHFIYSYHITSSIISADRDKMFWYVQLQRWCNKQKYLILHCQSLWKLIHHWECFYYVLTQFWLHSKKKKPYEWWFKAILICIFTLFQTE